MTTTRGQIPAPPDKRASQFGHAPGHTGHRKSADPSLFAIDRQQAERGLELGRGADAGSCHSAENLIHLSLAMGQRLSCALVAAPEPLVHQVKQVVPCPSGNLIPNITGQLPRKCNPATVYIVADNYVRESVVAEQLSLANQRLQPL
jgi:hypothetical protein